MPKSHSFISIFYCNVSHDAPKYPKKERNQIPQETWSKSLFDLLSRLSHSSVRQKRKHGRSLFAFFLVESTCRCASISFPSWTEGELAKKCAGSTRNFLCTWWNFQSPTVRSLCFNYMFLFSTCINNLRRNVPHVHDTSQGREYNGYPV